MISKNKQKTFKTQCLYATLCLTIFQLREIKLKQNKFPCIYCSIDLSDMLIGLKLWALFQKVPILMNCGIVVKLKKVSFWIPVWRLASSSTTTTVHNWSQSSFQRKQSQKYVKATTLATEVNHHSSEKNEAKADAICLLSETPLKEFRGYLRKSVMYTVLHKYRHTTFLAVNHGNHTMCVSSILSYTFFLIHMWMKKIEFWMFELKIGELWFFFSNCWIVNCFWPNFQRFISMKI